MTITVSCPSCSSSFPVDPAKIPSNGVRAQCSFCPEIFDIDSPVSVEESVVTLPAVEVEVEVEVDGTSDDFAEVADKLGLHDIVIETSALPGTHQPAAAAEPEVRDTPQEDSDSPKEEVEAAVPEVPGEAAPADEPETSPGPIRFGKRSPEDKAKSLARSLVSDLIAYNTDKHREAVATGTLQDVFGEEIVKSLKEYKEQVDSDVVAKGTFFNDALNSILADGEEMFKLKE